MKIQKLRFSLAIAALLALPGCAVNITTQNFLHQDEAVEPLDIDAMQAGLESDTAGFELSDMRSSTADGAELAGLQFTRDNARVNVVFYGGNGMTIGSSFTILKQFSKVPANVTWFDYRKSGASGAGESGDLNIEQLKQDALATFDIAKAHFDNDLPVVIHGLSMGSLLASHVAGERNIDGLVLDGAITSVPELIDGLTPFFASTTIQPELAEIDNAELLENYHGPLMFLAGEDDDTTPVEFARTLHALSPSEPKTLVVIPGAGHGYSMKSDKAIESYREFLQTL